MKSTIKSLRSQLNKQQPLKKILPLSVIVRATHLIIGYQPVYL